MKKNIAPLLFGIVFIIAGLGYVGSVLFHWNFTIFFDGWWTLFIIVPSFISICANGPKGFTVGAFLVGVLLLLSELGIWPVRYTGVAIVGVIIVSIGVTLIVNYFRQPKQPPVNPNVNPGNYNYSVGGYTVYTNTNAGPDASNPSGARPDAGGPTASQSAPNTGKNTAGGKYYAADPTDNPSYNAVLSSIETRNTSSNFSGAHIVAFWGGVDLDLRDAVVTHDITVYVTAVMGGVDILAPRNVRVNLSRTAVLGGVDCRAYTLGADSGAPVVNFVCTAVLGGIDVK